MRHAGFLLRIVRATCHENNAQRCLVQYAFLRKIVRTRIYWTPIALLKYLQQQVGQLEVTQMIDSECAFKSVFSFRRVQYLKPSIANEGS